MCQELWIPGVTAMVKQMKSHWEVWQNQTRTEQKKKTQQSPTEMGLRGNLR